ncbi:MAG: glycosyltransferase family 4 protein [Magnetococcales bacterium]|nr:glycosyltransferase family 4 protein [Magnetococcales bacterium]
MTETPLGPNHILVVFHTTFPETQGGINVMIDALVRAWTRMGLRVSLFAPAPWEQRGLSVTSFGPITLYKMRLRPYRDSRRPWRGLLGFLAELPVTMWRLHRLMRREGVDVVHFHTPREYQLVFQLLSLLGGPPGVLTFHGTDALEFARNQETKPGMLRWIVGRMAALTSVARHYARQIEAAHPALAGIRVIPNGIPPIEEESIAPCGVELPERFWVMVGWIEPPKAQDVAVRAWGEVRRHASDLHLVIVGDQPFVQPGQPYYPGFFEQVRQLARDNGADSRIHWVGSLPRAQVLNVLQRARGLIFPTHREGMPYVLLEAGAVGLPVVCNRIPPFTDLLESGRTGWLTPDSDHQALAEAVLRLEADPVRRRAMGSAWQEQVRRNYSREAMAEGYLVLFRELTGKPFGRDDRP